ncbi:2-amino-4-hydroxy-6-hydroxymethyldihydropteridine diphosphokinase [Luteibacter rhizovicinus DSM 16549]|uniref:2-amino-4-hydroxy-6-hydroxymethyldihydropteridine pyrophosphokinase n=1 Tax=Luteibacter rhizovicinus DSM 16549 TaxID=1440763 RepID=A0A0G9HCD0_9GAMM|nr:2-amino-4-hydroxy-6-hydroxymethyldihydropteridine diphosphokinase [Luteibacter rhizovicinus]APG06268.1 2-amino-4-hydroxy-6-hydroxymethyldihydropteridine diphosphokinase [Luteibacter rhizovicinus DSM 16549]KLD67283.1 2-amino-4-hydroxy-6-hydroxymethyldihydropteridine pyrophosphokinase [Luteibacter rhizovicinus DSM 16549]KLD74732.1 2-amino-4-hydroxy-6-hydroxymethyldihydropteridine pyrophosphokinase [Xanthomonas hyacinthi DSM 19077]
MVRALIGLGGNLGEVRERLDAAVASLDALPGVAVVARSRFYRTPPWGHIEQPDFVNAAIAVDTSLPPLALLDALLATERAFGRVRDGERWGPRTIDLDLLAYGDDVIDDERLAVPHPRIAERAFVLLPLADIASDAVLPGVGRVGDLLSKIDARACTPLP